MPKVKYDKQIIINNILELVEIEGFHELTVRKIAKKIGCSVAPIYTVFSNVQDAIEATKLEAMARVINETDQQFTEHVFLNIGVGLLTYARDHQRLYQELFLANPDENIVNILHQKSLQKMIESKQFDMLSRDELKHYHAKMWIFTQGLAVMVTSNQLKDTSTEFFIKAQGEVGTQLMTALMQGRQTKDKDSPEADKVSDQSIWDLW